MSLSLSQDKEMGSGGMLTLQEPDNNWAPAAGRGPRAARAAAEQNGAQSNVSVSVTVGAQ